MKGKERLRNSKSREQNKETQQPNAMWHPDWMLKQKRTVLYRRVCPLQNGCSPSTRERDLIWEQVLCRRDQVPTRSYSLSIQVAVTRYQEWLINNKFISHRSRGWKSWIRVPAWSGEDASPYLRLFVRWSPHYLITSQRSHPQTPSHCTLGFQHTNLGGTQTFGPQHQGTPSVARTQQKLEAGREDSCLVTLERAWTSWGRNFGLPASRTARE